MDRHTDTERKGPVVQHVDSEEHSGDESPPLERDLGWTDGVGTARRELCYIGRRGREEELEEGDEKA